MTEGPGERAEAARRLRTALIWAGFLLVGGALGAVMSTLGPGRAGTLPASIAIGATALLFAAMTVGNWIFFRNVDEVEVRAHMLAGAVAFNFYALLYPAWYLLWKGRLVPEPHDEILFLTTLIVMTVTYLWKRARQ